MGMEVLKGWVDPKASSAHSPGKSTNGSIPIPLCYQFAEFRTAYVLRILYHYKTHNRNRKSSKWNGWGPPSFSIVEHVLQ